MRHGRAASCPKASARRTGPAATRARRWASSARASGARGEQAPARVRALARVGEADGRERRRPSAPCPARASASAIPPPSELPATCAPVEPDARRANAATAPASAATVGGVVQRARVAVAGQVEATTSRSAAERGRAPAPTSGAASRCRGSGRAAGPLPRRTWARCHVCAKPRADVSFVQNGVSASTKWRTATGGALMAAVEDQAVTTGTDRGRARLQELAKRHLWMHFTPHGRLRRPRAPDHRPR